MEKETCNETKNIENKPKKIFQNTVKTSAKAADSPL